MVPFGSKALFGFAALTLAAGIAYGWDTRDASSTTILMFIALGAFALGVAVALAGADHGPWLAPDAPRAEQTPVGARPAKPAPWPLGAAIGFGLLAVGVSTNGAVLLAAAGVLALTGLAWLIQQWIEQPGYNPAFGRRVKERFVLPFGLPLGVLGLVAILAISMSRVFLALPEKGTRAAALAIAIVILISAFAVAASSRMARTALALLSSFALTAAIAAGIIGVVHGERKFEAPKIVKTFVPAPGQAAPTTSTVAPTTTTAP